MNRFFDGAFLMFGFDVIAFINSDQEDRIDPMIEIFPRMTKCTFYKYGVSGDLEKHDAMCILPLNVVNEKIYIFLWFWFIILSVLTFFTLIYRIVIIFSPRMRVYLLRMRYLWVLFFSVCGQSGVFQVPTGPERRHRPHRPTQQNGRLVPLLHARGERRLGYFSRRPPRAGQQVGQTQLSPHPRF